MAMRTRQAFLLSTLATAGFLFIASGCEDEQSKANEEASAQIAQARNEYRNATASPADQRVAELQGVANTLASADGDAAAVMEASARMDIALARLEDAETLEAENRALRSVVAGIAGASMQLEALASTNANFQTSDAEAVLNQARSRAQARLDELNNTISSLSGPVAELDSQNQAAGDRVAQLREQSRSLRDQAFEAGDLHGHSLIKQAVEIDKQADAIEAEMTQRQIRLQDQRSQLELAQIEAERMQAEIAAAAAARDDLQNTVSEYGNSARSVRSQLSTMESDIDELLGTIDANMTSLDSLYSEALGAAQTAASKANGRSGTGNAVYANAMQLQGRAHAMQAAGLQNHAALLAGLGGSHQSGMASTQSAANEALSSAKAAYEQAMQALDATGGGGSARDAALLRQLLNQAATGQPVDYSQFENETTGGSTPPAASGEGFQTHEELLAYAQGLPNDTTGFSRLIDLTYTHTQQQRDFVDAFRQMVPAMKAFQDAATAKFGASAGGAGDMLTMLMPDLSNATLLSETDDRAIYQVGTAFGGQDELPMIRINGSWWLEAEDVDDSMLSADDLRNSARQFEDLAQRINSGEIQTQQELMQALQQMGGF